MKLLLGLLLITSVNAQNMSPEEQKRLIEENKMLREEIRKMKSEPTNAQSMKMMEALQKGQKHQEESNKFLDELEKEGEL